MILDNAVMSPATPRLGEFRAYAHRGGAAENPENSPTAFAHAVSLGFRHLETDVRPTRDGVAVLHHDALLDRTTDAVGPVRERTWRDLHKVRLADGAAPLRLEELLGSYPDICVNVDVKEAGSVPAVHAAVERCRAWHRVCVTSFSARRISRVRGLAAPVTAAHPMEVLAHRSALPLPRRPQDGRLRLQVPLTVLGRPLVTEGFLAKARARGLAVDVWTIDDPAQMHLLIDLGVDGIMTDRPTALREVLQSRGLWTASRYSNTCS